eukprot:g28429.t1
MLFIPNQQFLRLQAQDIASPFKDAKMVPHDQLLTEDCVKKIMDWGHSRLFLYRRDASNPERRDDIMGVVLVKKLIGIAVADPHGTHGPESKYRIGNLLHAVKRPVVLSPNENLLATLNKSLALELAETFWSLTSVLACDPAKQAFGAAMDELKPSLSPIMT